MTNVDAASLKRDDDYCVDLARSVWLMDDHKWALYVREIFRQQVGGVASHLHMRLPLGR